jgi:hypothetical protein
LTNGILSAPPPSNSTMGVYSSISVNNLSSDYKWKFYNKLTHKCI